MPYSCPFPSRRKNSPACVPPVTTISSPIPARTSASTAKLTMGRSPIGSRCLFVIRVSGWRRLPVPPARMTPFTSATLLTHQPRPAVVVLLRRPDADQAPRLRSHRLREDACAVRLLRRAEPAPRGSGAHLQAVGPRPFSGSNLSPQRRLHCMPRHLRKRKAESVVGRLGDAVNGEQPALEPIQLGLVANEELDQRRHAGQLVRPQRRLAHVQRLRVRV